MALFAELTGLKNRKARAKKSKIWGKKIVILGS
jgi:hypothetical protein